MTGPAPVTAAALREYAELRTEHRALAGKLADRETHADLFGRLDGWLERHGVRDIVAADQLVFQAFLSNSNPEAPDGPDA